MIDQAAQKITLGELQTRFGIDADAARTVHSASGGWASFAAAAVEAGRATGRGLDELLGSPGMADYVVSSTADFDLPLSASDRHALEVLSLLSGFDEGVARTALDVAAEQWSDPPWADVETVLLRLQMTGAVVAHGHARWDVPLLIAAWARRTLAETEPEGVFVAIERNLADAFTAQLEMARSPDSLLIDNAVVLARRARAWTLLDRIFLACGYPLFYRHPHTAVAAFAQLPASALRTVPELGEATAVATQVQQAMLDADARPDVVLGDLIRAQVARLTATLHRARAAEDAGVGCASRDTDREADARTRFHSALAAMERLGSGGDHRAAAEVGIALNTQGLGRRPRAILRLQSSIHSVLAGEPGRALALLRPIEDEVKEDSVSGDLLAPSLVAWSALAAHLAGDHERADAELAEFDRLDDGPFVEERTFRPAELVARAYRSLDTLDLETAEAMIGRMRDFSEMGDLWVHAPVVERLFAQLTASSRSALLRSEESIEMRSQGAVLEGSAAELLLSSRVGMLISLGQLHRAEGQLEKLSGSSGAGQVLLVRSKLVAGHAAEAIRIAEAQYFENHVDTRARAELTGLKAVALLRSGDEDAACRAFHELLELSIWLGSLLPVVTLPIAERRRLLRLVAGEALRRQIVGAFAPESESAAAWSQKLETLGAAAVGQVDFPSLGRRELTLLEQLDRGSSVAAIARELALVEGTVKNNLSSLYRKLGVSGRDAAVARARALGYLGPAED